MNSVRKSHELEKIEEWQHKMYDPGHYLGGNVHPIVSSKSRLAGWVFFLGGGLWLIFFSMSVISAPPEGKLETTTLIVPFVIGLLMLIGGLRTLLGKR